MLVAGAQEGSPEQPGRVPSYSNRGMLICPQGHSADFISLRGTLSLSGDEPIFAQPSVGLTIVDNRGVSKGRHYGSEDERQDWRLYACATCGCVFLWTRTLPYKEAQP